MVLSDDIYDGDDSDSDDEEYADAEDATAELQHREQLMAERKEKKAQMIKEVW